MSVEALRDVSKATRHLPTIHILHAKHNVPCIILKRTVKRNDIGRAAIMANLQLSKDLFANVLLCINPYYLSREVLSVSDVGIQARERRTAHLSGHNHLRSSMHDFADCSSISSSKLFQHDQILASEVELELEAYL